MEIKKNFVSKVLMKTTLLNMAIKGGIKIRTTAQDLGRE